MIYTVKIKGMIDASGHTDILSRLGEYFTELARFQRKEREGSPPVPWHAGSKSEILLSDLETQKQRECKQTLKEAEKVEPPPNIDAWKMLLPQWQKLVMDAGHLREYKVKLDKVNEILFNRGWGWLQQMMLEFFHVAEDWDQTTLLRAFEYVIEKNEMGDRLLSEIGFFTEEEPPVSSSGELE